MMLSTGCLEIEIAVSIVVGDVLDHLMDERHLALRQLAVCKVFAEH